MNHTRLIEFCIFSNIIRFVKNPKPFNFNIDDERQAELSRFFKVAPFFVTVTTSETDWPKTV